MTPQSVKKMSPIPDDLFLVNQSFGEVLLAAKMSGAREFRLDCRRFLDRLVDKIRQTFFCSSPVSQGLYCFCPELLLDGDDDVVIDLFAKHVGSLGRCGLWSSGEVTESKAEFLSYVVEARQWHVSGRLFPSMSKMWWRIWCVNMLSSLVIVSCGCSSCVARLMRARMLLRHLSISILASVLFVLGCWRRVWEACSPLLALQVTTSLRSSPQLQSIESGSHWAVLMILWRKLILTLGKACALEILLICFAVWLVLTPLICRNRWRVLNHIIKQLTLPIAKFLLLPQLLNSGQHNCQLVRRPLCLQSLLASLKPRMMMEGRLWSQFLVVEVLLQNMLSLPVSEVEDSLARKVDPSRRAVLGRQRFPASWLTFITSIVDCCIVCLPWLG